MPSILHLMELSLKLTTFSDTNNSQQIQKNEITPCNVSDHHELKLDINSRNKRKLSDSWKLNSTLLNKILAKIEEKELKTF